MNEAQFELTQKKQSSAIRLFDHFDAIEITTITFYLGLLHICVTFRAPHSSTVATSGTTLVLKCGLSNSSFSIFPCSLYLLPAVDELNVNYTLIHSHIHV